MSESYATTVFTRHNLSLHSLLLENQPWFCARDIGRLMGFHLSDRIVNKLDKDQHCVLWVEYYHQPAKQLMLSESGVYALLVYHYAPENRSLREWLTHQVVPALRDAQASANEDRPMLSLLDWPQMSLSMLNWQGEGWIRLRDMPYLLQSHNQNPMKMAKPWRRRVMDIFQPSKHSLGQ